MAFNLRDLVAALLAAGVFAGIVVPVLAQALAPLVLPALFVMVTLSFLALSTQPLGSLLRIDRILWQVALWQLVAVPLAVLAFCYLAGLSRELSSMLILTATAGSVFASPALAHLLEIDSRMALRSMVLSTILMPASLLVFWNLLQSETCELSFAGYALRVGVFLVLPVAIALLWRPFALGRSGRAQASLETAFQWGALAALLVFGIGIMDGVTARLVADPLRVLTYLLAATGLGVVVMAATTVVMVRHGLEPALTAGVLCTYRNVALSYAMLGELATPELSIYVAVAQVPTFATPLLIRCLRRPRRLERRSLA